MVSVPSVTNLAQSAALAAITGAGFVPGTIGNASSESVPLGFVISQSPAAGSQATAGSAVNIVVSVGATTPVVIGTQIAGTYGDASGQSGQSHLFFAENAQVWWLLTLTSSGDTPGGTNHLVKAYVSSGPDLATATWTAAADSPGAAAAESSNCSNCVMAGGQGAGRGLRQQCADRRRACRNRDGVQRTGRRHGAHAGDGHRHGDQMEHVELPRCTGRDLVNATRCRARRVDRKVHPFRRTDPATGGRRQHQGVDQPDTGAAWTNGFSGVSADRQQHVASEQCDGVRGARQQPDALGVRQRRWPVAVLPAARAAFPNPI